MTLVLIGEARQGDVATIAHRTDAGGRMGGEQLLASRLEEGHGIGQQLQDETGVLIEACELFSGRKWK